MTATKSYCRSSFISVHGLESSPAYPTADTHADTAHLRTLTHTNTAHARTLTHTTHIYTGACIWHVNFKMCWLKGAKEIEPNPLAAVALVCFDRYQDRQRPKLMVSAYSKQGQLSSCRCTRLYLYNVQVSTTFPETVPATAAVSYCKDNGGRMFCRYWQCDCTSSNFCTYVLCLQRPTQSKENVS